MRSRKHARRPVAAAGPEEQSYTDRPFAAGPQPAVQAKLVLGPAGDRFEQEADRVAEQALQVPRPAQRESKAPLSVQRSGGQPGGLELAPEVAEGIGRARGGGAPLDAGVRAQMGASLGHDFGGVRVHTGPHADELNRAIGAAAFTTGSDVFFGQGRYQPGSPDGQRLIAHELAHVVQQGGHQGQVSAYRSFDKVVGKEQMGYKLADRVHETFGAVHIKTHPVADAKDPRVFDEFHVVFEKYNRNGYFFYTDQGALIESKSSGARLGVKGLQEAADAYAAEVTGSAPDVDAKAVQASIEAASKQKEKDAAKLAEINAMTVEERREKAKLAAAARGAGGTGGKFVPPHLRKGQ